MTTLDSNNASFTAIVAMAENRVIGDGGGIPWHLPGDMRWFKQTTWGHTIIMGRKTFQSIGKPLPGRSNVVMTRLTQPCAYPEGVKVCRTTAELVAELPQLPGKHFVIGGADIYRVLLPHTWEILLTRVAGSYPGDTFFPEFEGAFNQVEVLVNQPEYRIERWIRVGA